VILVTTLIGMVGLSRAGSLLFWKSAAVEQTGRVPSNALRADMAPAAALLALLVALALFAGPASEFAAAASDQLFAPEQVIRAVLGRGGS
jgi:multicomponent K+:H+ antiporter subunit D